MNNTCGRDSAVFVIRMLCTDQSIFRNYIHGSNNTFLNFVKDITLYGFPVKTYERRVILLKAIISVRNKRSIRKIS